MGQTSETVELASPVEDISKSPVEDISVSYSEHDHELEPQADYEEPIGRPLRQHHLPAKYNDCELDPRMNFGGFGSVATVCIYPVNLHVYHLNKVDKRYAPQSVLA
ncbi:unnamed protein product [Linum trigynum]|uniref:Uncharacterized protein n=1 Tax=Linum trigynum TaxID=586398 RepID=A0AAV2D075_9ROSI